MLTRLLGVLIAALLPIGAAALTESDAARIGREADVAGLRALVGERNPGLLFTAARSWNFGGARELPAPLEALIVEHYADPVLQRPLLGFVARDLERFERHPKYRTRRLFDLLYADLKARKDTLHLAIKIIATTLPVEAELAALLAQLDPAAANEIVMFLGARRYAPAVASLVALQERVPHERNTNQMIERVDWALLQIATPEAVQAVLERLRALGRMRTEAAGHEIWHILNYVGQLAPGSPPAVEQLAAALPGELSESAWAALVQIIVGRKERAGVPLLVRAIAESPKPEPAVDALLAIGTPADWRAARAPTPALQKKLDDAIADPARQMAQRERRERADALERGRRQFGEEKARIGALRTTHPQRYASEMRALLDRQDAAAGPLLAQDYLALAGFLRFTLRQPEEALSAYEAASERRRPDAFDVAAAAAADLQRFDKRDARKAIELYRRALASYRPRAGSQDAVLFAGLQRWLEHEIAYLERARRFTGSLGAADMESAFYWLAFYAQQDAIHPPPDPGSLARLPASQLQLARAFPAMLELAPEEMLPFFEKHDPAGYLTAGILAFVLAKEPSPYAKAAAERFFRARGIRTPFTPDARYASPEKTWGSFIASAGNADAAAMLDCFTPRMQAKLQELFERMSPDERRAMGASFAQFRMLESGGDYREAAIVREHKERKRAGIVRFVRLGASWKIDSM